MEYGEALTYLLSLVDLEQVSVRSSARRRYNLRRMSQLASRLGNPHLYTPAVHITGSKGKGSTAAMLSSVLTSAGYNTGLYTSPHLHTFRERIQINGVPLREQEFAAIFERIWLEVGASVSGSVPHGGLTYFELLTSIAFKVFAEYGCDFQVVEVGLGGARDATNILENPLACVLTSIGLDHTDILGDTLEKIARDKAGIIKSGAAVVIAPQSRAVFTLIEEACTRVGASPIGVGHSYTWERGSWEAKGQHFRIAGPNGERQLWIPLLGEHQLENAACVVATVDALQIQGAVITEKQLREGLQNVQWPARLEVLGQSPLVIVDGAHSPHSIRLLVSALHNYFNPGRLLLVCGFSLGHDLEGMVEETVKLGAERIIVAPSRHPRAVSAHDVMTVFASHGILTEKASSVAEATRTALRLAGNDDLVVGMGSLFVAAEIREEILGVPSEYYPEIQPDSVLSRLV